MGSEGKSLLVLLTPHDDPFKIHGLKAGWNVEVRKSEGRTVVAVPEEESFAQRSREFDSTELSSHQNQVLKRPRHATPLSIAWHAELSG